MLAIFLRAKVLFDLLNKHAPTSRRLCRYEKRVLAGMFKQCVMECLTNKGHIIKPFIEHNFYLLRSFHGLNHRFTPNRNRDIIFPYLQ